MIARIVAMGRSMSRIRLCQRYSLLIIVTVDYRIKGFRIKARSEMKSRDAEKLDNWNL